MSRREELALPAMQPEDTSKACPLSVLPPEILVLIIRALPHSDRLTVTRVCKRLDQLARTPEAGLVSFSYTQKCTPRHETFFPFFIFLQRWGPIVGGVELDTREWWANERQAGHMWWASTVQMLCSLPRLVDITWQSDFCEQDMNEDTFFLALLQGLGTRLKKVDFVPRDLPFDSLVDRFFVQKAWEKCTALKHFAAEYANIPSTEAYNMERITGVSLENCVYEEEGVLDHLMETAHGLVTFRASCSEDRDGNAPITSFRALSASLGRNLRVLELDGPNVSFDLSDIVCPHLEKLKFADFDRISLPPAPKLRDVYVLADSANISNLSVCMALCELYVEVSHDLDIPIVNFQCTTLKEVSFVIPSQQSLDTILGLENSGVSLKLLDVSCRNICSWAQFGDVLTHLTALQKLRVTNLDTGHINMEITSYPHLESAQLKNVSQLQSLGSGLGGENTSLRQMFVSRCPDLSDISALSHCTSLTSLELCHTPSVTSVRCCLALHPSLSEITINNPALDLLPLTSCPRLKPGQVKNVYHYENVSLLIAALQKRDHHRQKRRERKR